ncbi:hypothetical protein LOC67_18295 [Stieleria sp. JC731]|uniref:hypothetical protein n=1 Tax=Pirellulaceae TaxID=2691357 RepID=UPI001E2ABDC4|nr:hypothetical protein [Stieleria sp. JC731]MCC9602506.1 hypothetical protein [Stieleria sp. JC731]
MRALKFSLMMALAAAFVGCKQSTPEPTAVDDAPDVTMVSTDNEYCPMMGGKVSADGGTVEWNGKTIGFCCDGCDEKWEALTEEEKEAKFAAAEAKSEGEADHDHSDHDHGETNTGNTKLPD